MERELEIRIPKAKLDRWQVWYLRTLTGTLFFWAWWYWLTDWFANQVPIIFIGPEG